MSGGFLVRRLTPPLWGISASYYSPKLAQVCKTIPGMEWKGALRAWVGYVDAVECAVMGLKALGFNVNAETLPPTGSNYEHNLLASYERSRPYQKTGIDFLIANGPSGALLSDDMSLGKGHMSLRAARAFKNRTLIVCPSHVRGVWERAPAPEKDDAEGGEIWKWWPDAAHAGIFTCYSLTPAVIPPEALIAVIHYDILYAWADTIAAWGPRTVILDEGHFLQGATSRRSVAGRAVTRQAAVRIALTGTPMTGRPRDMHNLLDILSEDRFGEFFRYGIRYCAGQKVEIKIAGGVTKTVWNFDGRSHEEELHARLSRMMLRRTKREVAAEMPLKTRQIVDVNVKPSARVMPSFETLKHTAAMRRALDLSANAKLPDAISLVKSHLVAGNKTIAFTWRREVAERVAGECADICPTNFIHGGVAQGKRSKRIDDLRRLVGPGLLVCTIDSCSTGIDLSFADNGVFVELTWKAHDLLQTEDRLHRMGRKVPTLIQYVIGRGTADELVLAGVIRKLDTFEALIGKVGDGMKTDLEGEKEEEGLGRLAAALRKMTEEETPASVKRKKRKTA